MPAIPGKDDVDPVLAELDGRLVVLGTDADLAAVVVRLLRKSRLADVELGYVPAGPSAASRVWGLGSGDHAVDVAFTAATRPSTLVRDDQGGVLVGLGTVEPITGQVYCEDEQVLGGSALRLEVRPDPAAAPLREPTADPLSTDLDPATDGIHVVAVRRSLFGKQRTEAHGRAVQAGFRATTVVRDGVAHPRPATQWGWYRHTEDLALARP
ncbi:hypothetical protein GIY23_21765 [Allosaccharopolyspora coralli]|uniref:Uncharacterized protein n=1 Tax=Allosaccharopolyspora coralli TaxID=2665642 RepID=A0A5Q3QNY4_9PSEU|nr:hypothetical protein GIY23_21765 [Allosaccharopolyspora coralli]